MIDDLLTQKHAHVIAFDYNMTPVANLKTERVVGKKTDICSVWLATKNRTARCFAQYSADEIMRKPM
ncbi:unnamed protein product, partial [marine sediment metagenome]